MPLLLVAETITGKDKERQREYDHYRGLVAYTQNKITPWESGYYKFKSLGVWEIFPALFEVGKENYWFALGMH